MLVKFIDFLIFTNLFVAVPVTCLAYQTYFLSGIEPNFHFLLLVYFATLFTYCFHRVYPIRNTYEGEASNRFFWLQQNKGLFYGIMAMSLLATVVLAILDWSWQLIWFLPVGILALFYTLPVVPSKGTWLRLRDIPYLKVFLIAGVVTFVTAFLPLLYDDYGEIVLKPEFILIAIERALFLCAITLPFDIRDLNFDRQTKLKTIPGKFGVRVTKYISSILLIGFLVAATIRFAGYGGEEEVYFALILSEIVAGYFIRKSTPNSSEYFYSLGLEGTMIVQFVLVAIATQLF